MDSADSPDSLFVWLLTAAYNYPHKTVTALISIVFYILYIRYGRSDLRSIPGPFLASVSNLYRVYDQWLQRGIPNLLALHEKHGTFVRYGPNMVSISDGEAIAEIYGIGKGFVKSEFYPVQQTLSNGKPVEGIFNTTSDALHATFRRPVASMYSQSTLAGYEHLVDSTMRCFEKRMDELYANGTGEVCDWGQWLQYYAFDVIGELTFGKRLGFLDTGTDVENVMGAIEKFMAYAALVGQIPWLDCIFRRNPIMAHITSTTSFVTSFALKHLQARLSLLESSEKPQTRHADFLSKFVKAHQEKPEQVPRSHIISWTVSNVNAGSDTTAITLRTIFYFLMKNPSSMAKLCAEIAAAEEQGMFSEFVSWSESQKLPFLDAVIREALRLHPSVGMILERVVPKGGREICGHFFKEGTIVGMNAWVVHRDKAVFGEDAETWRPERWLEADPERRKKMDSCNLAFGAGSRTCLGKNISRLEMYKFVPQILRDYEIALADPQGEWKIQNEWLVRQTGLLVKLNRRK